MKWLKFWVTAGILLTVIALAIVYHNYRIRGEIEATENYVQSSPFSLVGLKPSGWYYAYTKKDSPAVILSKSRRALKSVSQTKKIMKLSLIYTGKHGRLSFSPLTLAEFQEGPARLIVFKETKKGYTPIRAYGFKRLASRRGPVFRARLTGDFSKNLLPTGKEMSNALEGDFDRKEVKRLKNNLWLLYK